jgi:7-cyano-7-deazaguanine synthase
VPSSATSYGDPSAPAVVLLSGGADSATCLAAARREGHICHCLTFTYGQRHAQEIAAARLVASRFGAASHRVIDVDLRAFGGSALTDDRLAVPKSDVPFAASEASGIPITYVPARNTIFLAYALGLAEVLGASAIYIGVNAVDYSGYPDCRPEFVAAFQKMADLATRAGVEGHGVRIITPLMHLTKAQIIRKGMELGVDFGQTHSCYDPSAAGKACGRCDSCRIRAAAFAELGMRDPALG